MSGLEYAMLTIALWNVVTFFLYGTDKRMAIKGERRISENTLLLCAFMMGGIGALFGMSVFRHKTKHLKFKIGVSLALLFNIAVIAYIYILVVFSGTEVTMLFEYSLKTEQENFYNITAKVRDATAKSGTTDGICVVYCPHTTAGITINEDADPDVVRDMLIGLDKAFPDRPEFRHAEGNSAAHLKASCVGASENVIIANGKLLLGTWQGIYFCEFDGPRNRKFYVKII